MMWLRVHRLWQNIPSGERGNYVKNNVRGKIIAVEMPERAPETGIAAGTRQVRLLCETRLKLWLCSEDADWALTFLRDQLDRSGFERFPADEVGPGRVPDDVCEADQPSPLAFQYEMKPVVEAN